MNVSAADSTLARELFVREDVALYVCSFLSVLDSVRYACALGDVRIQLDLSSSTAAQTNRSEALRVLSRYRVTGLRVHEWVDPSPFDFSVLSTFTFLRKLTLRKLEGFDDSIRSNSLVELELDSLSSFDSDIECPRLTSLRMRFCSNFTRRFDESCPNLVVLELRGLPLFDAPLDTLKDVDDLELAELDSFNSSLVFRNAKSSVGLFRLPRFSRFVECPKVAEFHVSDDVLLPLEMKLDECRYLVVGRDPHSSYCTHRFDRECSLIAPKLEFALLAGVFGPRGNLMVPKTTEIEMCYFNGPCFAIGDDGYEDPRNEALRLPIITRI